LVVVSLFRLEVVPCELRDARAFIEQYHRHHDPPKGHKFSVAVADPTREVRGVAITGRPTARMFQNGWTLEVVRLATDGYPNACSMLYATSWRAVRAMGYRRLVTYTLPEEGGVSLQAAGWRCLGEAGGGSWSRKERPRVDHHPTQIKMLWEAA
jgi:hypothetical protein